MRTGRSLGTWTVTLAAAGALCTASAAVAQERSLFTYTTDPKVITTMVQLSLPAAQNGLQLLTTGTDPESAAKAVNSINDSYKYLRAAQESSDLVGRTAKYPDPLLPLQAARMWEVRTFLLKCLDKRQYVAARDPETVSMCSENLIQGIRKLRFLVTIMP